LGDLLHGAASGISLVASISLGKVLLHLADLGFRGSILIRQLLSGALEILLLSLGLLSFRFRRRARSQLSLERAGASQNCVCTDQLCVGHLAIDGAR